MINIIKYIDESAKKYNIDNPNYKADISKFLVSNNWFGCKPKIKNKMIYLEDSDAEKICERVDAFLELYMSTEDKKVEYLLGELKKFAPDTANLFEKYIDTVKLNDEASYHLADFFVSFLAGDLTSSTDSEVTTLVEDAFDELPKVYSDILTDFINWVHRNTKTVYQNLYYMNQYSNKSDNNGAYEVDDYLTILYHLYNSDYIDENDMYYHAAESKNYADTWLFLALHFLCALRNTDIIRIPHPQLVYSPEDTIDQIKNGTMKSEDARRVIYSVIWQLEALMLTPHKVEDTSNVEAIKIHIPESVEIHMGMLFAVAEAHFQLACNEKDKPLIRVISKYEDINRYMGEEIGDLFLESDFKSRAANKSYLQMIYLLTDEILDVNDEFNVKGYILAALARSHKGSYGDFAKTTSIYLKDAKMNGYTPEFVAREMFERGVLSMIPSMLLKMISGEEYQKLSVDAQTKAIKTLNLSPGEIENTVKIMQKSVSTCTEIVKSIYQQHSKNEIIEILHKIGNGEAVAKADNFLCILTAMGKVCPYTNLSCINCDCEISTKTTMFIMAKEIDRLKKVYKTSESEFERKRSKAIAVDIISPCVEEMLQMVEENYGEDTLKTFESIIEEVAR